MKINHVIPCNDQKPNGRVFPGKDPESRESCRSYPRKSVNVLSMAFTRKKDSSESKQTLDTGSSPA